MKEFCLALFIGCWSFFVGLVSYLRLKSEYGKDEK